jgi:hypothetical protein
MKYLITESKLNSTIYDFIDNLFHDGKKIKMVKHTREDEDTLDDVEVPGAYDFFHEDSDDDLFTWTGREYYERPYNSSAWSKWLELAPVVEIENYEKVGQLDAYFGHLWRPIFIQWFEDTFSLPVKTLT